MAEEELTDKIREPEKEQKAKAAQGTTGYTIFDKVGSSLEDIVSVFKPSNIKKAAYYSYYTAKAALGLAAGVAIAGTSRALIFPVGMALGKVFSNWGKKEKTTYKQIANELTVGGILGGIVQHIFNGINFAGAAVKSAYGKLAGLSTQGALCLASIPTFIRTHEYINRALISGYKPQTWGDMGKQFKGPFKWLIPPILANYTVVPEYLGPVYQMPIAAAVAALYGATKDLNQKEEKKEKTPAEKYSPEQLQQLAQQAGYKPGAA